HRVKVRALLGYDPAEAGGLMSPDFVLLSGSSTAAGALEAVRTSRIAPELLGVVFVKAPDGTLAGSVPIATLLRAHESARLESEIRHELPCLTPDAPFEEV